jgi:two-component system chemotaxis response regulator CheY
MANILVVDDSLYLRVMIKKILKKIGHTIVAEAGNGLEAIEKYKEYTPDLVTMDVVMPKLNGLLAIKEILQIDPNCNIIIVTALGHEPMIREALRIGAKDFVIKPFKQDELVNAVVGVLG